MTPIERAENRAQAARWSLKKKLVGDVVPEVGLILGTGWGNALKPEGAKSIRFDEITGFGELQAIEGHARTVMFGKISGKNVIALNGRIHLNEHPTDPDIPRMVRLQIQMLLELGVRKFILTNAAGSLVQTCCVGDIVIADGFVTLFAPPMPLYAGEFCSPEDRLSPRMRSIAGECKPLKDGHVLLSHSGGYAMLRGPFFEGRRYDKQILSKTHARAVGMSTLPEMCIISLYDKAEALCLSFITNSDSEEHSHEANQARAKESSALLGAYLEQIIERI